MKNAERAATTIDPVILDTFVRLFFPRQDIHALQCRDGSYIFQREPVTPALVCKHLEGKLTLGTYCLTTESQARWVVMDADDDRTWQAIVSMAAQAGIPIYLELSRRGGHAWFFFEGLLPGAQVRSFGNAMIAQHQVSHVELYPKQARLADGPGSLIRLPLGIHRKTLTPGQPGKRFGFIHPDGMPIAETVRAQLALLAYAQTVPQAYIETVLANVPPPALPPLRVETGTPQNPLSERIKARIGVFDFIRQYVPLNEQGNGFCPFHDDQHRSFGVNVAKNYWSCFAGCGGGSIIDFWMKWRAAHGQDGSFTVTLADLARLLRL